MDNNFRLKAKWGMSTKKSRYFCSVCYVKEVCYEWKDRPLIEKKPKNFIISQCGSQKYRFSIKSLVESRDTSLAAIFVSQVEGRLCDENDPMGISLLVNE